MSTLTRGWDRFWFTPQATSTLALFRIAFGLLTVVWALTLVPDTPAFFAPGGLVEGHPAAPFVLVGLVVGGVAVTVGFWTRLACATVLFCLVWLHRVDPLVWNTGDILLRHLALFLTLAPAGDALSVDRWRHQPHRFWEFPRRTLWALRLVQVQVALMYAVTVVVKLQGSSWRGGEAVSYVLRIPEDVRFALPAHFVATPLSAYVLTYGTLAVEASIPLLVWVRRCRPYVLGLGLCLHVTIDLLLRTGLFSWIVLVSYLAFVPPETATRLLQRFGRRWPRRAEDQQGTFPDRGTAPRGTFAGDPCTVPPGVCAQDGRGGFAVKRPELMLNTIASFGEPVAALQNAPRRAKGMDTTGPSIRRRRSGSPGPVPRPDRTASGREPKRGSTA